MGGLVVRKRKKTRRSRTTKKSPRFLAVLFFLILFVGLGFYILTLPIWQINDVVVNGAQLLSPDEVRTMAGIPVSENLFFTSFKRTRKNLDKIPAIKKYKLYRIPPGTVLISLTERQPVATIVLPKRSIIIDGDGYILNHNKNITLNIANLANLPVISGIKVADLNKGDKIEDKAAEIVANVIVKLKDFHELDRIQLDLGNYQNITLLLDDLLKVKLGDSDQIKKKMEVFEALLPQIEGQWSRVKYVDVRYSENPVILLK